MSPGPRGFQTPRHILRGLYLCSCIYSDCSPIRPSRRVRRQLLCAVITIALGFCVGRLHKFFPTVVTGTIILSIGLSLYPIALKYMAGNASSPTYGQLNNWIVAFVTLAAVLFFNLMCKGVVKMAPSCWAPWWDTCWRCAWAWFILTVW